MAEEKSKNTLVMTAPNTDVEIMSFYNEAVRLQEFAETRVIVTVEDLKPASDDLSLIRWLKKAMEDKRRDYLAPFQGHIKEINETYKTLMEPIDAADKITTDKMLAFTREQNRIRQEQETINRLRIEAAQKDAALHNGKVSEPVNLVEVLPEAPKRVTTDMGSSGQRDNWKWELIDLKLVPVDYLKINAGVLTPIVKASKGKITIPGIRIYNEPTLTITR